MSLADQLRKEAQGLRYMAAEALEDGRLVYQLHGQTVVATAIEPLDLIDDAIALEAYAIKLETNYARD